DLNEKSLNDERCKSYAAEAGNKRFLREPNTVSLREKKISNVLTTIKQSMCVDFCFLLDCTESMTSHIDAAKDCILQVVDYVERTNPGIKIWFGFCGYRDHCDYRRLQFYYFTNSYQKFRNYISSKVVADGGGDEPEDVLGGLNPNELESNERPLSGWRPTWTNCRKRAGQDITNNTEEMLCVFRGIIGEFPVYDLSNTDGTLIAKLIQATCSAITTSVAQTSILDKGAEGAYLLRRKERELNKNEPDWHEHSIQTGTIAWFRPPESLANIKERKCFKNSNLSFEKISFKVAPQPFAIGAERYAYFALDVTDTLTNKIVIKEYIHPGVKANYIEQYLEAVEVATITHFLSTQFNLVATRVGVNRKVKFLKVNLLHHNTNGSDMQYNTVESSLDKTKFKRFNVNSGVITEFHSTLEAFAHFTYEYTEGYLVIYDLQGVECPDYFLLTDPAIHCTDTLRFGKTNLGKRGIEKCFLANHKCNTVCQKLGLIKL
ncbi:4456_t:CDS:2, partial [Ambispora gerdemannii]